MDVTWSALAGDTSKFAFELSFSRDTESHLYDADERASWGSFAIWVEGINLMEHVEQGEVLRAAHWYVLPTIEWFIRNWDAIFHEERLPLQNAGADAASAMTRLLIQPLGLVRRDLDEFERLRQWQTWWSRHNLADSSSGGIYPDLYLRRWGDLLEISTSSYTAEGTPSHFAYRNVDIVARPHVSDVSLAIHDVLTRAIGELQHRRPDSARIRELAEACAALENDGSRYERRLMFLSGVDPTDDQAVAAFRSLWSGVNEALRGLMSEGPLLTSDDSIRAAVGAASSGLVLETAPQLALLFGSYSPTITVDDVQVMIRSLHVAYSQARRIELPELPPLAYRGLTAGQEGVVSTSGSNRAGQEVGEDFCWGSVAEDTAWPVVELAGHEVEVGLVVGDLGALREVLAQQPVGVLVGAAFPRRVRVREVDVHSGREAERGVAGHLAALVPGEGLDQL